MADEQYQDPPVDEFGIPIRKKTDEKPLVDEFGIPVKKKEKETGFWKSAGSSADGGEAGSFAGSFGELAGTTAKNNNADNVKSYLSALPKAKLIKQGSPMVFEKPVKLTNEDVQQEILRKKPTDLLLVQKAINGDKDAELTLLSNEEPIINYIDRKMAVGQVSEDDLQKLSETYYGKKYLDFLTQKYGIGYNADRQERIQEDFNPASGWEDLRTAINRDNAMNGYNQQKELFADVDKKIADFYSSSDLVLTKADGFFDGPFNEKKLVMPDLKNKQALADQIELLEQSIFAVKEKKGVKGEKEIQEAIKLLKAKIFQIDSETDVDKEVEDMMPALINAAASFNNNKEYYGEKVDIENDEVSALHLKQGLSYIKYADKALYKNAIRSLKEKGTLAQKDFRIIAEAGQDIINNKIYRAGAYDPNLVDTQTKIDYTTPEDEKAEYAKLIGEYLKEKGYKNYRYYTKEEIMGAADALRLPKKKLAEELAEEEQLIGYDAIPKTGWREDIARGFNNYAEMAINTISGITKSPAQRYLDSRRDDVGTSQKISFLNSKGQVETGNYLPSERSSVSREFWEGLGGFIFQAGAAYAAGAPFGAAFRAGGAVASNIKKAEVVSGTLGSSYIIAKGQAYDSYLQKTGDPGIASIASNFDAAIQAGTEMFLPDVKIADDIARVIKKGYANDIVNLFKNSQNIADLRSGMRPLVKNIINSTIKGSSIIAKENIEELTANIGSFVVESVASPKTARKINLTEQNIETIRATTISMLAPAILGGIGGSAKEFTKSSFKDAAINIHETKSALDRALLDGEITQGQYNEARKTILTFRANLLNAPKVDVNGERLSGKRRDEYAFQKTISDLVSEKTKNEKDEVIKKATEVKAKEAEKEREAIINPDKENKKENTLELRGEDIDQRWKENIVAIGERTDISEEEKEKLKQEEDLRHAKEVAEFNKMVAAEKGIDTDQAETKTEDSLQPKAENKLTIEEEINELENEKADIETAAAEDGLTQEDEEMIAEIDRRIDDLKKLKEETPTPTDKVGEQSKKAIGLQDKIDNIERRRQGLRDLMAATGDDIFILGTQDGTFAGDGLLNLNENGDVVLTRHADSEEGLTKGKGKTENLANIAGQFGGEQIATSGVEGGAQSFINGVVGEYHIPLNELIQLIKDGYVVFAGLGNKEFVLSPHIADKYLTKINGKKINAKYDAELAELEKQAPTPTDKVGEGNSEEAAKVELPKGAKEVFHYSENENLKELEDREGGTWFTDNSYGYQRRGGVKGRVSKIIEPDKLNLASEKDVWKAGNGDWAEGIKKIKEQGFDGVKQTADGDKNYLIFDLKNVKDKSEYKPTLTQQNESKRQEKGQEELLGSDKQQAPDVVPGDNNSGGTAVSPAVSQYRQEWKPKSKRNKYKVTYDKNGKREVRIKGNGFKISENHPSYGTILRNHAAQYNYNVGQTTEAIPDKPQFNDKNEADIWLVENSQNPAEIAYAYSNMERQPVDMSSKEAAISREIGKVKRTSFNQFGDRNKVTFGMAKTYFNQQEGETLDNVAQRASRYGEGLDVTENDVVEFMLKFPYGVWPDSTVKSEAQRLAEDKFEQLTGIPLNPGNGSMTVANRAAAQYMAAERQQVMEQLNVEDASEVTDEEILNTDALTGWKPVEGESLFDNDKTENNDQAAQNQTAQGADGANAGTEEGTGQRTGGPEGGTGGASTGRDSGQENSGEGQEGRDTGQGQETGYTIEDFQKEIKEIGPLDEFTEDDLRNMDTPFMAATDNEAKLKAAQNVLAKAQRELNSAEDKIAKTQASQGGMFGQAAQGSMFAVNRDEAGEILGPLREAVKTARAEVDRLTAIVNDERRQADGQMSLFDAIQRQYPPATMKAFNKVQRAIESMFKGIIKGVKVLTGEDFESAIAITGADTSFSFVGVYAMLEDARNSWGRAVEMRTNGESADAIFNETGWFYDDLDNKWKYELKREGFVYKPEISPNDFKQVYVKNLDEVINYPELFEAYPEFRNFKVYGAPYKDISGAGGNGRILVNTSDSKYEQRQTILHEIQHEIQRREGFARGANREDGVRKVDEISRQTAERIAGLQKLRDSAVQQEVAEIDALIEVEQDYLNYIESNKENLADYFYAMYAGEIEARNIEARTLPRNRRKNPLATRDEIIDGRINHVTVDFGSRFMAKPDGTVYGFLHNGTIYINGDHLNLNTPIHEAAHLFTRWAQSNAPELYAAGQRLAGTSRAMLKIKADPFYQRQAQRMRDAGRSEAEIEAMFRDEALAFNVGNRGQFIADNQKSTFREWLKKFWNKIKAFFGKGDTKLENMGAEQFSNMSFDSFSQAMAERILSGERLEGGVQNTDTSFMATSNSKGARLAQAVQKLLATGFTEAQVKQQLMGNGFSEMVADNIIANAKRLPKYKPLVKKAKGSVVATPGNQITFTGNTDNNATRAYKAAKRWAKKYFTVNKGLPEFVLPLAEKTRGTQNWAINQAYKTVKQLKEAAKKIGFTDWDAVDAALRGLKGLNFTQPLSGQTAMQIFNPVMANNNRPLTAPPATIPQVLLNLPAELRPIVLKMRAQIDGLSHELTVNGYITPEQALVFEENLGEYVTRTYALFNDRNWAKKLQKDHPEIINEAIQFIYEQRFNEIKQADPTMPDDDARRQAEVDARRKVLDILEGMDMEYNPTKTKTVKGRDNGILQRREDIPEPIRKLMGEYTDPGAAFMQTIARMATLRGQAKFLADIRDIGMGTMFWERDDPNRPDDANVELRSPASATWFPLGGLYTTKEVADFFNEMEYVRNAAVQFWMNFVGAVRWGKTVGSVVTQFKNWESNIGFSIMNGHFYPAKTGDAWAYLWDQMKWWNGEKIESDLLAEASQLGLIGQNVGINELRDMFSSDASIKFITAASTQNQGLTRRLKKSPKQVFEYLNKLYSASDDFFKLYGFVNERKILAKAIYGNDFDTLNAEDKAAVNKEAAERVKNTYPTYDRVWDGAKYLSKNMPIFGNFLSFQAESIRVLLNSFQYAVNDIKNPAMRSAGLRRIAGISTYLGSRYAILYAIAQWTGFGMKGLFGGDDDDKEQAMEDISRFTMPFMANSEKLVRNVGPGKYIVYDLMSIEPYGIWFKTINALRDGLPSGVKEFMGPFMEKEMTFETYQKLEANESGRGGRIFDPNDPLGNKVSDAIAFVWKQLKPSTIGFIERSLQRDDKLNEAMALLGARGYSLDVTNAFSIKVYKAEEEKAELVKDYFAEVKPVTDENEIREIVKKYKGKLMKVTKELAEDRLAALRLGTDQEEIDARIYKASKKMIDVWGTDEIMLILGETDEAGFIFDKLGDREIIKKNSSSVDSIKEGVKSVAR